MLLLPLSLLPIVPADPNASGALRTTHSFPLPGQSGWDVQCGGGRVCQSDSPVCCSFPSAAAPDYCAPGGNKCCSAFVKPDANGSAQPVEGWCPYGTTCCPTRAANGYGVTCCGNSSRGEESCFAGPDGLGACAPDACRRFGTPSACLVGAATSTCGWCCATAACVSAAAVCPGTDFLRPGGRGQCADNCSYVTDCDECSASTDLSGRPCGWCCSSGRCVSSAARDTQCTDYQWAQTAVQCAACGPGGKGLYHVGSGTELLAFFCVFLPMTGGLVAAACACRSSRLRQSCQCRCSLRRALLRWLLRDDEGQALRDAVSGGVVKYGFIGSDSGSSGASPSQASRQPTVRARIGRLVLTASSDGRCVICMQAESAIVFLPCYHAHCCVSCAKELERRAAMQPQHPHLVSSSQRRMRCPVCREPVETMVNLGRLVQLPSAPCSTVGSPQPRAPSQQLTASPSVSPHSSPRRRVLPAADDEGADPRALGLRTLPRDVAAPAAEAEAEAEVDPEAAPPQVAGGFTCQ